jgi:hypothetical protein
MKFEGKFRGTPIYSDPNAPKGMIYLINENNLGFYGIDARSRFRRIIDWIKTRACQLARHVRLT